MLMMRMGQHPMRRGGFDPAWTRQNWVSTRQKWVLRQAKLGQVGQQVTHHVEEDAAAATWVALVSRPNGGQCPLRWRAALVRLPSGTKRRAATADRQDQRQMRCRAAGVKMAEHSTCTQPTTATAAVEAPR